MKTTTKQKKKPSLDADILSDLGLNRNARAIQKTKEEIHSLQDLLSAQIDILNRHVRATNNLRLDEALERDGYRVGSQHKVMYYGVETFCAISQIDLNYTFNKLTDFSLRPTECPENTLYERVLGIIDHATRNPVARIHFVPLTKAGKPMTSRVFQQYYKLNEGLDK